LLVRLAEILAQSIDVDANEQLVTDFWVDDFLNRKCGPGV
jgi:hypothetical protein